MAIEDRLYDYANNNSLSEDIAIQQFPAKIELLEKQDALKKGVQAYKRNLLIMAQFASQRGAKFYHFYQPLVTGRQIFNDAEKGMWKPFGRQVGLNSSEFNQIYNKTQEDMLSDLKNHGVISVNLNKNSFIQRYPRPIFLDAMHLNDLGLKVVAQEIAQVIKDE